jgi:hypothetical protein
MHGRGGVGLYVLALVAQLVMAWMLAGIIIVPLSKPLSRWPHVGRNGAPGKDWLTRSLLSQPEAGSNENSSDKR